MKREEFLRHLRRYASFLYREGRRHSIYENTLNGKRETVPRHVEIDNHLVRRICRNLDIPTPWDKSK